MCHSEVVLSGYDGALGDELRSPGLRLALIPDGVSAITYALADGRAFTVPVAGNLATPPAELSPQTPLQHPTAAELGKQLAAHLPTTVTESSTGAGPSVTLARPVSLIPDTVGSLLVPAAAAELELSPARAATPAPARRAAPGPTAAWP